MVDPRSPRGHGHGRGRGRGQLWRGRRINSTKASVYPRGTLWARAPTNKQTNKSFNRVPIGIRSRARSVYHADADKVAKLACVYNDYNAEYISTLSLSHASISVSKIRSPLRGRCSEPPRPTRLPGQGVRSVAFKCSRHLVKYGSSHLAI